MTGLKNVRMLMTGLKNVRMLMTGLKNDQIHRLDSVTDVAQDSANLTC